jgi:hypothetical protein
MSYFTSKYYILGLAYATFKNHCTLVYTTDHTKPIQPREVTSLCNWLTDSSISFMPNFLVFVNFSRSIHYTYTTFSTVYS